MFCFVIIISFILGLHSLFIFIFISVLKKGIVQWIHNYIALFILHDYFI